MKNFFHILSIVLLCGAMWSCEYDDTALWDKVENLDDRIETLEAAVKTANSDIDALRQLVDAMKNDVTIKSVTSTGNSYTIKFSDNTEVSISNGRDGLNAPAISVIQKEGIWYWALDGKIIEVDGKPLKAEGKDGADGNDGAQGAPGITPQVRINETTKEWEICTDGVTWTSTGIVAEGKDGNSIFAGVEETEKEVIFTLADETVIIIPKASAVKFSIAFPENLPKGSADGTVGVARIHAFAFGEKKELSFTGDVTDTEVMNVPQGWTAKVNNNTKTVTVTAPAFDGTYYQEGILTLIAVNADGETVLAYAKICAIDYSDPESTFVLNEGNMSSDNGSVIYITAGGQVLNYAYWRMNGTELGNALQDLFIAGDKLYMLSQNGGNDGVFVETDAKTLKNTGKFSKGDLPALSMPTHVAVVGRTAYIRDNKGVYSLDLDTRVLTFIEGTKGAQKNRMAVDGNKVFVPGSNAVLVLQNGALVETVAMDGNVTGVINANDGYLWVSCSTKPARIIKLNASDYTTETHTVEMGGVGAGWGSTPGISAKGDDIYFTNNTSTVYRHNFTSDTTVELGDVKSNVANWGMMYNMPAVHPVTGEYYYTTIKGYGMNFLINDISVFDVSAETPVMVADYRNYTHMPAGIFFPANFR